MVKKEKFKIYLESNRVKNAYLNKFLTIQQFDETL